MNATRLDIAFWSLLVCGSCHHYEGGLGTVATATFLGVAVLTLFMGRRLEATGS